MLNVTQEFKNDIQKLGRQIDVIVSYDDVELDGEYVVSCTKEFQGSLYSSIMQFVNIELEGKHDLKDKTINVKLGVSFNGSTFSYADYGKFIVDNDSIEFVEETDSTKFSAYDFIYKSCKTYDSSKITFPTTVGGLLSQICILLDLTYTNLEFPNSTKELRSDPFENIEVTYRDIFDYISELSGRNIIMNSNRLIVKPFEDSGVIFDENSLSSLKISSKWGPVNSIVLAREPQEDNIYKNDGTSIEIYGLTEVRIADNYIVETERELFLDNLFDAIKDTTFNAYESVSFGYGYLQPCDVVTLVDLSGNQFTSVVMKSSLQINTGIKETFGFEIPEITTTDYNKATKKERKEKNATLYVDKQLAIISGQVDEIQSTSNSNTERISKLELSSEQFEVSITEKVEKIESEVTVTDITPKYGKSNDTSVEPTEWYSTKPTVGENEYLWMREIYTYSNGKTKINEARIISAKDGQDAVLLQILSSNGHIFKNNLTSTTLTVEILVAGLRITSSRDMYSYFGENAKIVWQQKKQGEATYRDIDSSDPRLSDNAFIFTINTEDLKYETVYSCYLDC